MSKLVAKISFDLHVLSMPPAFILSQDQTLHDSVTDDRSKGFMMRDWNSIAHPYSAKLKPKGDRLDLLF
jgi:hypothetical protein